MNVNVIITTYNYGDLVAQAVDSVLAQTYGKITRIIVVDDGSSDGTAGLLERRYGQNTKIILVQKDNGGQLSALNCAFGRLDDGCDLVFFLDADDLYEANYVQEAVRYYERSGDCDFLFCKRRYFGALDEVEKSRYPDGACGPCVLRTYYLKEWVGNATSMLSMRRGILKKILPIPYETEWRIRADDCLVWASSLVGAGKYCMDRALVRYRAHDKNYHYGRTYTADVMLKRKASIDRLFSHIMAKNNVRVDLGTALSELIGWIRAKWGQRR